MARRVYRSEKETEAADFDSMDLQKQQILQMLKDRGCRITRQRELILEVILEGECSSCKEIYYRVKRKNAAIGPATVYRMVNLLEEIGVISRKNMYKIE